MHDNATAHYVVRDHPVQGRRLWWAPPGGAAWDLLPLGDRGPRVAGQSGAREVAEAILLHATGDFAGARDHAATFRSEVVDSRLADGGLRLRAADVEKWLVGHGIALVSGWGPIGPTPVVVCARLASCTDGYTVTLDGWELLRVDIDDNRAAARVEVIDVDRRARWVGGVTIADAADGHRPLPVGTRVTVESLPFGGWAIQVDEYDVAIVERDPARATHARVAVYDRGRDVEFQRFDEPVAYRDLPAEPVSISERLRRFAAASSRERVLGR